MLDTADTTGEVELQAGAGAGEVDESEVDAGEPTGEVVASATAFDAVDAAFDVVAASGCAVLCLLMAAVSVGVSGAVAAAAAALSSASGCRVCFLCKCCTTISKASSLSISALSSAL